MLNYWRDLRCENMWKCEHPLQINRQAATEQVTRGISNKNFVEPKTTKTFIRNASRQWNKAPNQIRNAKTISMAKKEIRKHFEKLPIHRGLA